MFGDIGRQAMEYMRDAQQRTVMYLDVMRQGGDQYVEHVSQGKPPVLVFEHELIADGRELPDPVNYALLRIVPPADMPTNPDARPFVIIDPRAGHGPGVAGSKVHSEIGVALAAGHPCYFVTFGPVPEPNQSIYCILKAEVHFLNVVAELHDPLKVGRPFLIGNCQGGWALMMLASVAPKLVGPLMLAGAPLAYWSGKKGQNPMRYSGGMLGGSWGSSFTSDIGDGIFDGAYLVDNFENLNPANTFWDKPYRLYANIDTEAERYLGFDRWWTGHFLMTRQEIDWIVQNLFIGNRLSRAKLPDPLSNGNINLRNIRSPILVFASKGDNITPPAQALNWIPDLYESDEDLRANEQVIIYNVHETTGHLGIFVSSGIANREHEALVGSLDLIELLPPGLYEAVIQDLQPNMPHQEWVEGRHVVVFEPRTIDDLRKLDDGREDEENFEVVNRISKTNQHIYDLAVSPIVRSLSNPWVAQATRTLHPKRLSRYAWSSLNPLALFFTPLATQARANRTPVAEDNMFLAAERVMGDSISRSLDTWRIIRDQTVEAVFEGVYGSPWIRSLVGIDAETAKQRGAVVSESGLREEVQELRRQLSLAQVNDGGAAAAFARILIYIVGEDTFIDERAYNLFHSLLKNCEQNDILPDLESIKRELRKQWRIVQMHPKEAIAALSKLVPNPEQRVLIWNIVDRMTEFGEELRKDDEAMNVRLNEVKLAFDLPTTKVTNTSEQVAEVVAKEAVVETQAKSVSEVRATVEIDVDPAVKTAVKTAKTTKTAKKAANKTTAARKTTSKTSKAKSTKKVVSNQASLALSEDTPKPVAAWPTGKTKK